MNIFNIIIGVLTIIGLGVTLVAFYKERNNNRIKRERTEIILKEKINDSINHIEKSYKAFNNNLNQYKETVKNNSEFEYGHRLDLLTYFINSYGNEYFLNKLKETRNTIEEYYINNIDDSNFNYNKYHETKRDLNDLIKVLDYYIYQINIFLEPYDKFLNYNLNQKIIYKNDEISNDLVTNNFNFTSNDVIINPILYYKRIIGEYDKYFSDFENLVVPLMVITDDEMTVKSFIDIDFTDVHEKVDNIIKKIKKI
ncbi:hypothetical protein KYJ98_08385 [Mammaliicoccus lentus]|uniref:hypothetical protein n=1 Tax=Mammaliicoccus lentus TaxID=42858 RepID=UPI001C4DF091|nr:hypothetical protein [Mammaliicoccus lentus]MBW0770363.1 hypothetical protein [Mammaliicoccus lentus]